jgi:hypothetical protein
MLIHHAFGLQTRTIVGSEGDRNFIGRDGVLDLVGASSDPKNFQDLIEEAKNSEQVYIVKTHDAPLTDDPTIYVLRDGRSSVVSYYHFVNEIGNYTCGVEQIVRGQVYPGSWSEHLQLWSPDTRKNTLIVRYEDLAANPSCSLQRISSFLGITQSGTYGINFEDLHAKFPAFFRVGNDAQNIEELERSGFNDLFNELHADAMRRYGYYR